MATRPRFSGVVSGTRRCNWCSQNRGGVHRLPAVRSGFRIRPFLNGRHGIEAWWVGYADSGPVDRVPEDNVALMIAAGRMTHVDIINCPNLPLSGTPDAVAQACCAAVYGGVQILSPECAVPLTTPTSNLQPLVDAAESVIRAVR